MSKLTPGLIKRELMESGRVQQATASACEKAIEEAAQDMAGTLKAGGKLLLCGNGGSAADCQHLAAELVVWATKGLSRPGLKAIALTTDTSVLTSAANDFGFEHVFAVQVNALGEPGDLLMLMSTSGNSKNLVVAAEAARKKGIKTVGLLGQGGGQLGSLVDISIIVPSDDVMHIQEAHISICHVLCKQVCDLMQVGSGGN